MRFGAEDFARRIKALQWRGLSADVAMKLWYSGDEQLVAELERATDDQMRQVNALQEAQG